MSQCLKHTHVHTHTQTHIPYWFYFSGEPWPMHRGKTVKWFSSYPGTMERFCSNLYYPYPPLSEDCQHQTWLCAEQEPFSVENCTTSPLYEQNKACRCDSLWPNVYCLCYLKVYALLHKQHVMTVWKMAPSYRTPEGKGIETTDMTNLQVLNINVNKR